MESDASCALWESKNRDAARRRIPSADDSAIRLIKTLGRRLPAFSENAVSVDVSERVAEEKETLTLLAEKVLPTRLARLVRLGDWARREINVFSALVADDPEPANLIAVIARLSDAADDPVAENVLLAALTRLPTFALVTAREKGTDLDIDASFVLEADFVVIARLVSIAILALEAENAANLALIVARVASALLDAERIFPTDFTIAAVLIFAAVRRDETERAR